MKTSIEQILEYCKQAFPDREGLSIESLNPLAGNQHSVAAFHLHAKNAPSQALIFRRYPSPVGWFRFEDDDRAAREHAVLGWLGEKEIPAQTPLAHGLDDKGQWLLLEAIGGMSWWYPLGMVDFNRVLPGIVRQQVTLIVRLHAYDPDPLMGSDAPIPTLTVTDVLDIYEDRIKTDIVGRDRNEGILKALQQVGALMADDEERPARLINGDAALSNVLIQRDGTISAWTDWDEAAFGDPRWDIAAMVNSLRGAYQMDELAETAVKRYEKESLRPVKNLTSWVAMLAVLRWTQSAWLKVVTGKGLIVTDFPSAGRFMAATDSHRSWAMEMLKEAEIEKGEV